MTDNVTNLMDRILADVDIQNAVEAYGSGYAIWNDVVIPQDFTGSKSILVYQVSNADFTMGHDDFRYSASCRAATYKESRTIANLLISKLNRYNVKGEGIRMSMLPTVLPQDQTDKFNTPVEISYITKL